MGQRKNLTYVIPIKTTKNIFSYSLIKITLVGRDNSFITQFESIWLAIRIIWGITPENSCYY